MPIHFIARQRFPILAAAALVIGAAGASAGELPSYQQSGFSISPVQISVLGSAHVQEQAPSATLALSGMPASPHQLAVLSPSNERDRREPTQEAKQATLAGQPILRDPM